MEDPTHPTRREAHRIETRRLIIRTAAPGDAPDIAALRGDPENNPYGDADSNDPEVYKGRISRWQKANAEGRYAFLVILLRDSGRFIGFGGYNEFRWINPPGSQTEGKQDALEVDIGAQIDHRYWRQGYAREAFVAMVEYVFNDLGGVQISCDTSIANEPWRRLMQSVGLGAKEEKQVNPEGHPASGETSLVDEHRSRSQADSCLNPGDILSIGYNTESATTLNANPMCFLADDGVREDEVLASVEYHVSQQQ